MAFAMNAAKYVPPPTITRETVQAYAHCPDPRCEGTRQQTVQAVRETSEWTFESRGGGDDPGGIGNLFLKMVENSQVRFEFSDPADLACPSCGKSRELSDAPRPSYPIQVGGPNALLRLQDMGLNFDPDRQEKIAAGAPETPIELLQRKFINDEVSETEFAAKRATLSGVAEAPSGDRIAALEAQLAELLAKRGPGRPRREPDA